MGLIADAQAKAAERPGPRPIDYDRMRRVWPQQKAALTRARKTGDPERIARVCRDAVAVWNEIGAWPDDWHLFQRTLDDALPYWQHVAIEDL